ncbi:MAG: sulfotransferase family protein, partial [Gammaproteobacteria bacterium]
TTLVEAIVGAHPDVTAGGEMHFLYDWLQRDMGPAPDQMAPAWLAQANDATLARLAQDWRAHLDKVGKGKQRVTDKFPFNFLLLGLIAVVFPDADIVHVRRDPRDTCVSCYTTALAGRGLPARLGELGAYYREYETLMEHWRSVLGRERIIEVEYEQLVRNTEPAARKLLAALGLDWRPECLSFHESRETIATASLYQVRQPVYSSSIGKWQRFEPHLLTLLEALTEESPQ